METRKPVKAVSAIDSKEDAELIMEGDTTRMVAYIEEWEVVPTFEGDPDITIDPCMTKPYWYDEMEQIESAL